MDDPIVPKWMDVPVTDSRTNSLPPRQNSLRTEVARIPFRHIDSDLLGASFFCDLVELEPLPDDPTWEQALGARRAGAARSAIQAQRYLRKRDRSYVGDVVTSNRRVVCSVSASALSTLALKSASSVRDFGDLSVHLPHGRYI